MTLNVERYRAYGGPWIVSIEDISDFVRTQHAMLKEQGLAALVTPNEEVYPVEEPQVCKSLGVDRP